MLKVVAIAALSTALFFGIGLSSDANAGTATPTFGDSASSDSIGQVFELVPLDKDGSRFMILANDYDKAGSRNQIAVADSKGSIVRKVPGYGESPAFDLNVSPNGEWSAWQGNAGYHSTIFRAKVWDGKAKPIKGGGPVYANGWIAPTNNGTIFGIGRGKDFDRGYDRLVYSRSGRAFVRTPWVGSAPSVRQPSSFNVVHEGESAAICQNDTNRRRFSIRLGTLDKKSEVVRFKKAPGKFSSIDWGRSCGVSNDGSTVATLAKRGNRVKLVVGGDRKVRVLSLPRFATTVSRISPSGRFVLVGGGRDSTNDSYETSGRFAVVVDTKKNRFRRIPGVSRHSRRVNFQTGGYLPAGMKTPVWSPDESRLAVGIRPAGLLIVSSATGRSRFIRPPRSRGKVRISRSASSVMFSPNGKRLLYVMEDPSGRLTTQQPFSVSIRGGDSEYMLSRSVESFGEIVTSPDGSRAWLLPDFLCRNAAWWPALDLETESLFSSPIVLASR